MAKNKLFKGVLTLVMVTAVASDVQANDDQKSSIENREVIDLGYA